jgi:hypothetical protein
LEFTHFSAFCWWFYYEIRNRNSIQRTTAEANTKSHAEQLALAHARQNGFKAKPKKIIVKEIKE